MALFLFGALPADDPRIESHMRKIRERLWVRTGIGGVARYERDSYHQVEHHNLDDIPGNPWIVCTLWYAMWLIMKARTLDELKESLPYLEWTHARANAGGILAEQYHPYHGAPISVSPLTWSHATYMTTVMKYMEKHRRLSGGAARASEIEAEYRA